MKTILLWLCLAGVAAGSEPEYLINTAVFAGQSNLGIANWPVPVSLPIGHRYDTSPRANDSWQRLAGVGSNNMVGVDAGFGMRINNLLLPDEEWAVQRFARGGTSLAFHWLADGLYEEFIDWSLDTMAAVEHPGNRAFEVEAFVWVQGEGDASSLARATAYEDNLGILSSLVRASYENPSLPIFINQLHVDEIGVYSDVLRAGQNAWAESGGHNYIIDIDDLELGPDGIHLTVESKWTMGQRFASAYIASRSNPEPSSIVLAALALAGLLTCRRRRRA